MSPPVAASSSVRTPSSTMGHVRIRHPTPPFAAAPRSLASAVGLAARSWHALECRGKLGWPDRLADVVVHAGRQACLAVAGHGVRRHGHDLQRPIRPSRANAPRGLQPVELRHLDVHQHHVERHRARARRWPAGRRRRPRPRSSSGSAAAGRASGSPRCPRPAGCAADAARPAATAAPSAGAARGDRLGHHVAEQDVAIVSCRPDGLTGFASQPASFGLVTIAHARPTRG